MMRRYSRVGVQRLLICRATPPPSSSYHTIQAIPREFTGSRLASRLRSLGNIPSIVFAQSQVVVNNGRPVSRKQLLTTERKQIQSLIKSVQLPFFCSTTFLLQIRAGSGSCQLLESGRVLPIKVQRNQETGEILNLVFVWADEGSELTVDVPVVFKGEDLCPGLKKGGHLNKIRTSLKYLCPAEHIPPKIEVDLSNLDIEDRVFLRDIEVHQSLKLLSKNDTMPICKIVTTKPEDPKRAATAEDLNPVAKSEDLEPAVI